MQLWLKSWVVRDPGGRWLRWESSFLMTKTGLSWEMSRDQSERVIFSHCWSLRGRPGDCAEPIIMIAISSTWLLAGIYFLFNSLWFCLLRLYNFEYVDFVALYVSGIVSCQNFASIASMATSDGSYLFSCVSMYCVESFPVFLMCDIGALSKERVLWEFKMVKRT